MLIAIWHKGRAQNVLMSHESMELLLREPMIHFTLKKAPHFLLIIWPPKIIKKFRKKASGPLLISLKTHVEFKELGSNMYVL